MPSCHSAHRTLLRKVCLQPPANHTQWHLRQQHLARSYSTAEEGENIRKDEKASSRNLGLSSLDAESSYLDLILGSRGQQDPLPLVEDDGHGDALSGLHTSTSTLTSTRRRRERGVLSKRTRQMRTMDSGTFHHESTGTRRAQAASLRPARSTTAARHVLFKKQPDFNTKSESSAEALAADGLLSSDLQRKEATAASGPHTEWFQEITRLVRRYQGKATGTRTESQPPTAAPEAITEFENFMEKLESLEKVTIGCLQNSISPSLWSQALLWCLYHNPSRASDFMLATFEPIYSRNVCIQDSLRYLALHYDHAENEAGIDRLVEISSALSEAWSQVQYLHGRWHGRWYVPIIPFCGLATVIRFFDDMMEYTKVDRVHWSTWLHFVGQFAQREQFDKALSAILEAKAAGAALDSYAFRSSCANLLRRSVRQPGGLRACIRILDNMVRIGLPLNNHLANIIMLNAVEAGDLKIAFSIYHSLVDHGLEADAYTYAILLKGCKAAINDADLLNETIHEALSRIDIHQSSVVSTEILHCLALHHTKRHPEQAFEIVADAYAQLFDLDPLRQIGLVPPKLSQAREQQEARPLPSRYDMYIMVATHLEQFFQQHNPDPRSAYELYQRFKAAIQAGQEPFATMALDEHTFNAFLSTFIKSKRGLLYAAELVKDMQGKSRPKEQEPSKTVFCQPTVYTWSIFLDGFTRHGQMRLAEQVLDYMRSKGIEPNRVTYNTLVRGYATSQDAENMLNTLRRMETDGNTWDEWTVRGTQKLRNQALLNEALKKQKQAEALDFTGDLRVGLEQKLASAEMEVHDTRAHKETAHERADRTYLEGSDDDFASSGFSSTPALRETNYTPM